MYYTPNSSSFFCFNNTFTKMFNFFQIPVKLITRQVHTWSLIPIPFDIKMAFQRKVYLILQPGRAPGWSPLSESLLYKGLLFCQ